MTFQTVPGYGEQPGYERAIFIGTPVFNQLVKNILGQILAQHAIAGHLVQKIVHVFVMSVKKDLEHIQIAFGNLLHQYFI